MAQWNLTRLAETLLPLLSEDQDAAIADAEDALAAFGPRFEQRYRAGLMGKLGIGDPNEDDMMLANAILSAMTENQVDFTLFFRRLSDAQVAERGDEAVRSLFVDPTRCDDLLGLWRDRLARDPQGAADRRTAMNAVNPAFIPRNHRIEAMIVAAIEGDFAPMDELLTVLATPYADLPEWARYAEPPRVHERVLATFCGT